MDGTRWMVQTLSLRDMDELYEMDGTNLISESHGHRTICVTEHSNGQDELYEMDGTNLVSESHSHRTIGVTEHSNGQDELYKYGDNSGEPTGKVT